MKLMENALVLVHDVIKNNLNTQLASIQAEIGDGLTLDPPLSTSYSYWELDAISQLPFVQILPDVSNNVIPGGTWEELDHNLIVICHTFSKRGKIEDCAKITYRYARAIWEILLDDRTLSDNIIGIWTKTIDYKPIMSDGYGLKGEVWIHAAVKNVTS